MGIKFKNDRFRHARDGQVKHLRIVCTQCDQTVCEYQKDGHGQLLRLYVDRIFNQTVDITSASLVCSRGHVLAVRILYEKERRPAFRLIPGMVKKNMVK